MMHHTIATTLLFLLDIDAIYGIGGECFLHVLASGASVLTADQQRFMQFGIARQLRIILPPLAPGGAGAVAGVGAGAVAGVGAVSAVGHGAQVVIVSGAASPAPTPPTTPRRA